MSSSCATCAGTGWVPDWGDDYPMAQGWISCPDCRLGSQVEHEQKKRIEIQNRNGGKLL